MARPTIYDPDELIPSLVEWIAEGKPMSQWCRMEGHPSMRWVNDLRKHNADVAAKVAHAREIGFDVIAEDCLNIADDNGLDTRMVTDTRGQDREMTDGDVIQRSKLRVETRLKLLACWDPRRYGHKQQIDHEGGFSIEVTTGVPKHGEE